MNGADLPMLNGYPLRLVVPGYYGTYWVKHLNEITRARQGVRRLLDEARLPHPRQRLRLRRPGNGARRPRCRSAASTSAPSSPASADGARVPAGADAAVRGIAFDGGSRHHARSRSRPTAGKTWTAAQLGEDLGRYSFRALDADGCALPPGPHAIKVRATGNRSAQSQPMEPRGTRRATCATWSRPSACTAA